MKKIVHRLKSLIDKKGFRFLFPALYILGILVSLIILFSPYVIPSLGECKGGSWGFCLPTVVGLAILIAGPLSFPGFAVGRLIPLLGAPSWFRYTFVFVISLLSYYLIGLTIDRLRRRSHKKTTSQK